MSELTIIYIIIILAVVVIIITSGKNCYYCDDKLNKKKPVFSLGHDSCMRCKVSNDKVVNSAKHK